MHNHITQEEAQWILSVWAPERTHSYLSYDRLYKHARMQSIIRNKQISVPSCKCEYATFQKISNSLWQQFETIIRETAAGNQQ